MPARISFSVKTLIVLLMGLFCLPRNVFGDPWADSVIVIEFGQGAGFGYNYFPDNILGPPDTNATPGRPCASQQELLALGTGGRIVLGFFDGGIVDEPGPDFTVFENPFYIGGDTTNPFAETGIVAASEDGEVFFTFSYNPDTWEGLAGVTPTNGWADPTDPNQSGGDTFDLADVGLSRAIYIQITDAAAMVPDLGLSFDLDAVVAVHGEGQSGVAFGKPPMVPQAVRILGNWPNPFNASTTIRFYLSQPTRVQLSIWDILGRRVDVLKDGWLPFGQSTVTWDAGGLASGVYYVRLSANEQQVVRPVMLIR